MRTIKTIQCEHCGRETPKLISEINKARRMGRRLYCSVACYHLDRSIKAPRHREQARQKQRQLRKLFATNPLMQHERKIMPVPFSGCWIWVGDISNKGYGRVRGQNKRYRFAHRIIYEFVRGPVPSGLELDHLCRVRCCVNPDHLEAVTHEVNMQRGQWKPRELWKPARRRAA